MGLTLVLVVVLARHPVGAAFTAATSGTGNSVMAAQPALAIASPVPAQGTAGSTVTVSGSGLPVNSALSATFGGSPVTLSGATSTNAGGGFTGSTFTVPSAGAGSHDVVVTAGTWSTPPVAFVIPSYSAIVTATAGLANYWRLGAGTTTTAVPDSRGGATGTASGGFTPGAAGAVAGDTAAAFDGTSGRVDLGNPTALQSSQASVELWFRAPATDAADHELASKAGAFGLDIYNHRLVLWDDGAGTYYSTGIVVDDNLWHHVVLTYQSGVAGGTRIYLDGALVFTGTLTVADHSYPLILGAWRYTNGTFGEYFRGTLDEVATYNTVLGPGTVLEHFRAR